MATALDHSAFPDHEDNGNIYSMCRSEPLPEMQSSMPDSQPAHFGFDGSQERRLVHGTNRQDLHDVHHFFQQAKTKPKTSAETALPLGPRMEKETQSVHADPDLDRRKRRRITPSEFATSHEFMEGHEGVNANGTISGNRTSVERADEVDVGMPPDNENNNTTTSPQLHEQNQNDTAAAARQTEQAVQNDPHAVHADSSMHDQNQEISERKVLSLNKDGTLSTPDSRGGRSVKLEGQDRPSTRAPSRKRMKMRNGKFVQSFELVLKYGHDQASRKVLGNRIDAILSASERITTVHTPKTHPFFIGKSKQKVRGGVSNFTIQESRQQDNAAQEKAPVAWNDLKFSSNRGPMLKSSSAVRAMWPPLQLQHVGRINHSEESLHRHQNLFPNNAKLKAQAVLAESVGDILLEFPQAFAQALHDVGIRLPQRKLMSGARLLDSVADGSSETLQDSALGKLYSKIKHGASAFDRGETSGQQSWTNKYAPMDCQDVLQPTCQVLRDWLKGLAVHNVKSGAVQCGKKDQDKPPRKKRRQKKSVDDLDDFIVDDDVDEDALNSKAPKNALLITGPHGCGKTASVFAAAKEMNFEVFEIHPGMRRTAKDIFDKVGDMTSNHLVQRKDDLSRSSSVGPLETFAGPPAVTDRSQPSLNGFLTTQKNNKTIRAETLDKPPQRREQKQSLILFEEVDILFESDKSFWAGVQNLIHQSKRPVVMTCNDVTQVPVSELDLFTILEYQAIDEAVAVQHLVAMCASEGHIIGRDAVRHLYNSKRKDFRATVNELSFWCQMTTGSRQGGLDWMFSSRRNEERLDPNKEKVRICSDGTFHLGLDLLPETGLDNEQMVNFCQHSLELPASIWITTDSTATTNGLTDGTMALKQLDHLAKYNDARSALDIVDDEAASVLAATMMTTNSEGKDEDLRKQVTERYITSTKQHGSLTLDDLIDTFSPIAVEKPTFPPSQGRLAPSIDAHRQVIATDIAPYVRSIVSYDWQLELQREELFGSQGKKSRNTRAARAAAEGGDKAHTRTERWFPQDLDFKSVLATGNRWPQWF